MSRLTFAQIKAQAALVGQNNATPIWVDRKFKAWLRKHWAAWPWPFLIGQATGVQLVAGDSSVSVGAGNNGITRGITRIFAPVYWRGSSYSQRGRAEVRPFVDQPVDSQEELNDPQVQRGAPQLVRIQDSIDDTTGKLYKKLIVFPYADQTYNLSFTYQVLPDDPGESDIIPYPNEMTLLQAAKVAALEYDQTNDPIYKQEADILAQMVAADRTTYGANPSFGDTMQLDSATFLP